MTSAIILSIGDELVLGQTVDTNSAWLSQQLAAIGVRIAAHATVPDDQPAVEEAIRAAAVKCDILLISGGIGPTEDDLTRQALAAVLHVPLELNDVALHALSAFFRFLKREMPESNQIQAMLPRGSTMIQNTCGTAPGIRVDVAVEGSGFRVQGSENTAEERKRDGSPSVSLNPHVCHIFVVPGVPKEMKAMFLRNILPELQKAGGGAAIVSRTLHTFGLGESSIGEMLGELMKRGRNPSVGTTVAGGVVSVRVNSYFESRERAIEELEKTVAACREKLGDLIYGRDDETLATVLAAMLKDSGKRVSTAESCTGGLLAKYLTDTAGSSAYFTHGWVTYANEAKAGELGVSAETLKEHGAVSESVVLEMAEGARRRAGADVSLSISGIAGPDGGTAAKPVGTVCIGLAHAGGASARTFRFSGDREFVRDRSAKMALTMLRFHLIGKAMPF
jgi:nicotinamide-nucleotide amidase